jgi:hypothetical protein
MIYSRNPARYALENQAGSVIVLAVSRTFTEGSAAFAAGGETRLRRISRAVMRATALLAVVLVLVKGDSLEGSY